MPNKEPLSVNHLGYIECSSHEEHSKGAAVRKILPVNPKMRGTGVEYVRTHDEIIFPSKLNKFENQMESE